MDERFLGAVEGLFFSAVFISLGYLLAKTIAVFIGKNIGTTGYYIGCVLLGILVRIILNSTTGA